MGGLRESVLCERGRLVRKWRVEGDRQGWCLRGVSEEEDHGLVEERKEGEVTGVLAGGFEDGECLLLDAADGPL